VTGTELGILAFLAVGGVAASVGSYQSSGGDDAYGSRIVECVLTGPVIAVLPFENASAGEEGAAFIVDGILRQILTNLSEMTGVNAVSRTSVLAAATVGRTMAEIAGELNASAILEGTVQRAGSQIQIAVSLIDALNEVQLWGDSYLRAWDPESVFAVQGEIAGRIAEALAITLAPGEQSRLTQAPTRDQQALELFMLGQNAEDQADRGDRAQWDVARDFYEQAIARDSLFADAHAARAIVIDKDYWMFTRGDERFPETVESIRVAAERAVELDPELATGYLALGNYYLQHEHDGARAIENYVATRRLDPDNVHALKSLANLNMHAGDWDAARADLYRAAELDPMEAQSQKLLGDLEWYTRRYEEADAAYRRSAARFAPEFAGGEPDPRLFPRTERASATLREVMELVDAGARQLSLLLSDDFPSNPVDIGPTMLGIDEFREALVAFPEFHERIWWAGMPKAWMLRVSGEDPTEEKRIWGAQGDMVLRGPMPELGTELELRTMAALMFARAGRTDESRAQLARAREIAEIVNFASIELNMEPRWAMTLMELGEHEQALDMLEDMLSRPSGISANLLRVQPQWDPIRDHPRFQALLAAG
jgi:serine/threonine-protein kinase